MNKVWFIFRGDHHLGPFSAREILRMYEEGKINAETLLWCEGDPGWKALRLQERLVSVERPRPRATPKAAVPEVREEELPPDLPPLPDLPPEMDELPPPTPEQEAQEVSIDTEQETQIALESVFVPQEKLSAHEELHASSEAEDSIDPFFEKSKNTQATTLKWIWPLRALTGLVVLFLSYQLLFTNVGPWKIGGYALRRMPGISKDVEQQLHRFSRENRGEFKATMALGHKGQVLWLASGLLGEGHMSLRLISKSDELLGDDEVLVEAQAPYFGGAAVFDVFKFVKGQGLIPGRYEALLTYRATGFWDGIRQRLSSITGSKQDAKRSLKFNYLYFLGAPEQFETALAAFGQKKEKESQRAFESEQAPLKLQLEFYSTLKELTEKLTNLYEDVLKRIEKGNQIDLFTTRYAKEIEPLYRPLTLESKAKMEDPMLGATEKLEWQEIHMLYRSVGDMISDMQSMTSRRALLNKSTKDRLIRIFTARRSELIELCEQKKAELTKRINPIQN